MASFTDDLAITLSLTIAGQTYNILAENVKSLELSLYSYGFNGKISVQMPAEEDTDELFTPITTQNDLIKLSLQVETFVKSSDATSTPLSLEGVVTSRSFTEQTLTNVLPSQELIVSRN